MRIAVFNGSPKGENSNTNVIVEAFLRGAQSAGAQTHNIFLIDRAISHCSGCFACWFRTPGKCIHRDDMDELLPLYKRCDIVCFATPVYLWNMTACLKNFLDRLIPTRSPNVVEAGGQYDMESAPGKLPETVIVANAGFPGQSNFDTMRAVMKSARPLLEIYRNQGMALRMKREDVREKVRAYLAYVEEAGSLIASGRELTAHVTEGLAAELLSDEAYLALIGGAP